MIDLGATVAPKSDQLNSDDLITGPRTIRVTRVTAGGGEDQPVSIYFEGDGGKPYKPGKSMRRVLIQVWGADGAAYVGRSMTIYRDLDVRFGGMDVGGIRISHMSDLAKPMTMALTETRAKKKPFTVKPLAAAQTRAEAPRLQNDAPSQAPSDTPPSLADRVTKAVGYYGQAVEERQVASCETKFAPLREECATAGATDLVQRIDTARTTARARLSPSAPDASEGERT